MPELDIKALGRDFDVATVLTVYGIETKQKNLLKLTLVVVATVLTVYGIETLLYIRILYI